MRHRIWFVLLLFLSTTLYAQDYEKIKQHWLDSLRTATAEVLRDSIIRQNGDSMKLWWTVYGEKPADGPIDSMYRVLIRTMIAHYDVNPDKVYLLGYSAGGDGVWRMAPRMADHWAAASMMAGHPGDVKQENLLNTPYMIWCGAKDTAYDRNRLNKERGLVMDSLQNAHPDGYIHETHILEGKGHWMDREDAAALPWMAQYKRQTWPKHIIWQQEAVFRPTFYWLEAPREELSRGKRVDVTVKGNTINISRMDYSSLTLYLSNELLDISKPVIVKLRGKKVFKGRIKPSAEVYRNSLYLREDYRFATPYRIEVR